MVPGIDGGYTGPDDIYPELAKEIIAYPNLISVQMDHRFRGNLDPCVQDLLETIDILKLNYNVRRVVLVATVGSQTTGAGSVGQLSRKGKACLFIHCTGDDCLSPTCSRELYQLAGQPKELVLYYGDNHGVTNHRYQAREKIKEFALQYLCIPIY
ncbi:unnamed protein product [Rotaria sp. Silwood1]|nr:unnamed protein product [Rotaria sp. Silwood1]CAF3757177.1 unnamed protein product [Rotaria sp. Silwood1]CAF4913142.1 unnamed protein product [Rotaria sp. Silwood1]